MALGGCLAIFAAFSHVVAADDQSPPSEARSRAAVHALELALAQGRLWGEPLAAHDFARVALTKDAAAKARTLLWQRHAALIVKERAAEINASVLTLDKHVMPLFHTSFGQQPKAGWSLWISMHGGGGAPKVVNDQQWENQKRLYRLEEGIYVAPRTDRQLESVARGPHR